VSKIDENTADKPGLSRRVPALTASNKYFFYSGVQMKNFGSDLSASMAYPTILRIQIPRKNLAWLPLKKYIFANGLRLFKNGDLGNYLRVYVL
jgi:hypothetical protein